jgi:hypothetical protein
LSWALVLGLLAGAGLSGAVANRELVQFNRTAQQRHRWACVALSLASLGMAAVALLITVRG